LNRINKMSIKRKRYKIIGISGSPRDKSTSYMLKTVLGATGCDYELILLKEKNIQQCTVCGGCFYSHKCIKKDDMQELYDKLLRAKVIVLGCPTYFANVTALMKVFMDRCLPLYLSERLKGKKVVLLSVGNFKKREVRYLDNFDIERAMKDPLSKKELKITIQRCIDIMKFFCIYHMKMKIIGSVIAINGDPKSKKNELVKLGKNIISYKYK